MVVGEIAERTDLLVLGGGVGGYVAAFRAAERGIRVTLVERRGAAGLGGVCLHEGCIPSKALIEYAGKVAGARELVAAPSWEPDLAGPRDRRVQASDRLARGIEARMASLGVQVLTGHARFNRPDRVAVESGDAVSFLDFERCIIATGSRPRELPALAPDGDRVVDSSGALQVTSLPARVVVVGGGYIGLELGTAYAKLGSAVTVVEAGTELLPGTERDLVRPVLAGLERRGVQVLTASRPVGLSGDDLVVVDAQGIERRLPSDLVVVAAGRRPNTDDVGLERARIATTATGHVEVDDRSLVRPGLAAIGDVTPGPAFAHRASAQAVVAVDALAGDTGAVVPEVIPSIVFTDPEIATVGSTLREAEARGLRARAFTASLRASGRASAVNNDGFYRIVVDVGNDVVVGAQVVSPHASDVISELTLAIELGASPADLALTVHPHPTFSESFHDAAVAATPLSPTLGA